MNGWIISWCEMNCVLVKPMVMFWLVSLVLLELAVCQLSWFFWCAESRKATFVITNQSMAPPKAWVHNMWGTVIFCDARNVHIQFLLNYQDPVCWTILFSYCTIKHNIKERTVDVSLPWYIWLIYFFICGIITLFWNMLIFIHFNVSKNGFNLVGLHIIHDQLSTPKKSLQG